MPLATTHVEPRPLPTAALVVIALILAVGSLILFHFDPSSSRYYPRCLFHECTGLYCPGCGSTRALHAMLHLHLLTAARFNPLTVLAVPFVAYRIGRAALRRFIPQALPPLRPIHPRWIWLLLVCVVVFWILRNVPMRPFTWLAPPTVD